MVYLGSNKVRINLNNKIYNIELLSKIPILNGIGLLSSGNYTLKDVNGLYLTVKESE